MTPTTIDPVAESEALLQRLASKLHDQAFASGKPQSFAESLSRAATEILAAAPADFPPAARKNLLRYAPEQPVPEPPAATDPIAEAEAQAEAAVEPEPAHQAPAV